MVWKGKTALHAAIDDATGNIVGLYFENQETLNGYYHVTHQFLNKYGKKYKIKTDVKRDEFKTRGTTLIYILKNNKHTSLKIL